MSKLNWDELYEHAFCINLKKRTDRKETCDKIFAKLNMKVEYYHPKKHPIDGRIGCFESHIKLIKLALKKGYKRLAIFEDDIEEYDTIDENVIKKISKFLKENKDWNIFFLGCIPEIRTSITKPTTTLKIHEVAGLCTHAYIINEPLMKKMANMEWLGIPIDYIYVKIEKCYTLEFPLFIQCISKSDIHTNFWDNIPVPLTKILLKIYIYLTHFYAYNINVPLYSFKIIIYIILCIILCWLLIKYNIIKKKLMIPLYFITILYLLLKLAR